MRAQRLTDSRTGVRAAALLLICVLVLTLASAGTAAQPHKHTGRSPAVLAAAGFDTQHAGARPDAPGVPAGTVPVATTSRWPAGTSDSSAPVISRTAQAPLVRGPPGQAAV